MGVGVRVYKRAIGVRAAVVGADDVEAQATKSPNASPTRQQQATLVCDRVIGVIILSFVKENKQLTGSTRRFLLPDHIEWVKMQCFFVPRDRLML